MTEFFTWSYRYVIYQGELMLAEVDFENDQDRIGGWTPIDEQDYNLAVVVAANYAPIDMVLPPYLPANHPELLQEEALKEAFEEVLVKQLEEEQELYLRKVREQAVADAAIALILSRLASAPAAPAAPAAPSAAAPAPAVPASVPAVPASAAPAAALSSLIQKWIEKNQKGEPDLSGAIDFSHPIWCDALVEAVVYGLTNSIFFEEEEDRHRSQKKQQKKTTRARGGNSKPKGKRPWRENR